MKLPGSALIPYVRLRKLSQRGVFVPLEHPWGDAQADFGEAMVVIAGVGAQGLMDLPQSDDDFVIAFPAETRGRSDRNGHWERCETGSPITSTSWR